MKTSSRVWKSVLVLLSLTALWQGGANGERQRSAMNGKILLTVSEGGLAYQTQIYAINPDGSDLTRLTTNPPNWACKDAAWSPDGTQIAFSGWGVTVFHEHRDIYLMNANGSNLRCLTNSAYDPSFTDNYRAPAWSPDGRKIVFCRIPVPNGSGSEASWQLYVIDADGNNQIRLTNDIGGYYPTWSPDGARIAFSHSTGNDSQIYLINADGSNLRQLTNTLGYNGAQRWSPDGTKIAFSRRAGSSSLIYVMNPDGTSEVKLFGDDGPMWAPDGKRIAFANGNIINFIDPDGSHYSWLQLPVPGIMTSWQRLPIR